MAGCTHVIHLAAIVGGIANFHRLPHTLTEVNNALYNSVVRAALDRDVERFVYVSSLDGVRARRAVPDARGLPGRLPGAPLRLRVLQADRRGLLPAAHDEHGLPYTICRPFNAYGPGEMPDDEPGIAHAVPDLIRKVAGPASAPLQIFGSGEQTRTLTHVDDIADGIVTAMASPAGLNEDFNISAGAS